MTAIDLLARNPDPTEEEIRHGLEGNFCRCTGYQNIVAAVQLAASTMPASQRHASQTRSANVVDPTGADGPAGRREPLRQILMATIFGSGIKRREDPRLITGTATYTDDSSFRASTYAAFLRSPVRARTDHEHRLRAAEERAGRHRRLYRGRHQGPGRSGPLRLERAQLRSQDPARIRCSRTTRCATRATA